MDGVAIFVYRNDYFCEHNLSMIRDIIRSEETFQETRKWNSVRGLEMYKISDGDIPQLIEELYQYKDIIDYNSWICIITETVDNQFISSYDINAANNLVIKSTYSINDNQARRYIDATTTSTSTYTTNDPKFTYPKCALLFDKNNNCRLINIQTKLLKELYTHAFNPTQLNNYKLFNLGRLLWYIDFNYNPESNKVCNVSIKIEHIPFISKNKPSPSCFNEYESYAPKHLTEWLDNNIDRIRKDLGLIMKPDPVPQYKYIEISEINNNAKKQHIKELLEQLRSYGVNVTAV